jgi:phosphorylase kinase alpha/beta subunit
MVEEGLLTFEPALHQVVLRSVQFLATIRFYEDKDSGAWEEGRAVRASSVGAVCAGLRAWYDILHDYDHTRAHQMFELYQSGMRALQGILPYETRTGEASREYDAALMFLVQPLHVLTGPVADELVTRIRTHLMGERGIKRYRGDAFWGPEYDQLPEHLRTADASTDATFRAQYAVEGKEAEWTIFDPLLAMHFFDRHHNTQKADDAIEAAQHLNRSLAALVRTNEGKLLMPELYYHSGGALVPNTIVPLYWAQANLLSALA